MRMQPLLQREQLAFRRSTAALAGATERSRSTPVTHFLGRNEVGSSVTWPLPSYSTAGCPADRS